MACRRHERAPSASSHVNGKQKRNKSSSVVGRRCCCCCRCSRCCSVRSRSSPIVVGFILSLSLSFASRSFVLAKRIGSSRHNNRKRNYARHGPRLIGWKRRRRRSFDGPARTATTRKCTDVELGKHFGRRTTTFFGGRISTLQSWPMKLISAPLVDQHG